MPANLFRLTSVIVLPLAIASFGSGCNSSDPSQVVPVVPVEGNPNPIQPSEPDPAEQPTALFRDQKVTIDPGNDPLQTIANLPDGDAEGSLVAGLLSPSTNPAGFITSGSCHVRNTHLPAAGGRWRFELGDSCTLMQLSSNRLNRGHAVSALFDAYAHDEQSDARLTVQLVSRSDSGDLSVLSERDYTLTGGEQWRSHQLVVGYGEHDDHAGEILGIRFIQASGDAGISIDNIELSLFEDRPPSNAVVFLDDWNAQCDQIWAGKHFWSNRLQDWEVKDARLVTRGASPFRPNRTTHRLTTGVSEAPANFTLSVSTGTTTSPGTGSFSGMLLGAGSRMDYRSAALVHNRHGHHGGLIAGIDHTGRVFLQDNDISAARLANGEPSSASSIEGAMLQLDALYNDTGWYTLRLFATDDQGTVLSATQSEVRAERLLGNIAVLSNPGTGNTLHWFDNWTGSGAKLRELPGRQLGPVLFASYTQSNKVVTLNAQYSVVCTEAIGPVTLQLLSEGSWQDAATATIDPEAYTARFQLSNHDGEHLARYRIATPMQSQESDYVHYFEGVIQADPGSEPDFVLGVFNCRPGLINSATEGWIQQNNNLPFSWTRDRIVFPHEELLGNAEQHKLDMAVFLGDQIYEFDPNGLIEKRVDHLVNDYLWKWFQFGWSARQIMRNTPTFILPDDHDVYQGNVWGEGGIKAEAEQDGGFVFPAWFVNIVQKTQTGSLPEPHDPTPLAQGITSYYTDIVYGGVGMAVLEDRKFKTGPHSSQTPRQLLGDKQHAFLENWAADWQGHSLKLAVSQSPFSQSTTHSGKDFNRIALDQDSNGWPKAGRDAAVHALRKAFAPHIAGDQHLGMTLKHGIALPGDAVYSFAGPSMLNIFPRIWDPVNTENGPGDKSSRYRGDYTDAHGNLISVLAAANPEIYYRPLPTVDTPSKNDLGIGYGIVRLSKHSGEYTFEAWPANTNPSDADAAPYPHWPITVSQQDNDGRVPTGYLPTRQAAVEQPVVQLFSEADNQLIYARRYPGPQVTLPVFDNQASYRVVLSEPESGYRELFEGQRAR